MKYTFQKYIDIATSADSVNIIKIKAGGKDVLNRTKHLFGAYKYFKLGGIKIKLVPASTLPVDPRGLSLDDSQIYTVDPRDQLNPGLVRITNGENVCAHLSGVTPEIQDLAYTNTMLDPRWSKFMLQSGFSRFAYPLYYNLGEFEQSEYPDAWRNLPLTGPGQSANPNSAEVEDTCALYDFYSATSQNQPQHCMINNRSSSRGIHQVGHRGKLGWMPTDSYEVFRYKDKDDTVVTPSFGTSMIASIPAIDILTIIFPRAHRTLYYYRLFITETVYFKGLKNTGIGNSSEGVVGEVRSFDNFLFVDTPRPAFPMDQESITKRNPQQPNDGGWSL